MKLILLAMAAGLVLSAACSSGGDSETPEGPTVDATVLAVAPADALLLASAGLRSATASRAEFSWSIERDGFDVNGDGEYAMRAASDLLLEVHYRGKGSVPSEFEEANDSELLVLGEQVFLKTPSLSEDWVLFTAQEFGADYGVVQRLLAARSPLDIAATLPASGEVSDGGFEEVGGRSCRRLDFTGDASTLAAALADAYGSQGQIVLANRYDGDVPVSVWVDPESNTPCKIVADGEISYLGEPTRFRIEVTFSDINGDVELPAAPDGAVPIADFAVE